MISNVKSAIARRTKRVRKNITGTIFRPRLSVFRSNRFMYAQLIDDKSGKTLVSVGDMTKSVHMGKSKVVASKELGVELAKRALEKKIQNVIFDRGSYRYHGRVKSLADGAREGGLKF